LVKVRTLDFGDFPSGLDNTSDPVQADPNSLRDMLNCRWKDPSILQRRYGTERWGSSTAWGTTPTKCLGLVEGFQENEIVSVLNDGKAYRSSGKSQDWAAISGATGLSTSVFWTWCKSSSIAAGITISVKENCEDYTLWTGTEALSQDATFYTEGVKSVKCFFSGTPTDAVIESCDATTGWTASDEATSVVVNTSNKTQGTGSLGWGKQGKTSLYATQTKTITPFNGTGKELYVDIRRETEGTDHQLDTVNTCTIFIFKGSESTKYYYLVTTKAQIDAGFVTWGDPSHKGVRRGGSLTSAWTAVGSPDITALDTIQVKWKMSDIDQELNAGKLYMDNWFTRTYAPTQSMTRTLGGTFNGTGLSFYTDVYISESDLALALLDAPTFTWKIGESNSKYYYKTFTASELAAGWNKIGGTFATLSSTGTPAIASLAYCQMTFTRTPSSRVWGLYVDNWRTETVASNYKVVGTNGVDAPVLWDGVTWDNTTIAASDLTLAKYVESFWNRTLYGNLTYAGNHYANRLYYSSLDAPATVVNTSWINLGNDEQITGIYKLGRDCYVFKPKQIYKITYTADSAIPFVPDRISDSIGAEPYTVQNTGDSLIFLCKNQGVFRLDTFGNPPLKISDPVWNTIDTFTINPRSAINRSRSHYYLWDKDGAESNCPLVFDYGRQIWTRYQLGFTPDISCQLTWNGAYDTCLLGTANGTTGFVVAPDFEGNLTDVQFSTSSDQFYTSRIQTQWYEWGVPMRKKRFKRLGVIGVQDDGGIFSVAFSLDGQTTFTDCTTTFDLYAAGRRENIYYTLPRPKGYGLAVKLTNTPTALADSGNWELYNFHLQAQVLGDI
jgi:hypothetical protein